METSGKSNMFIYSFNKHPLIAHGELGPVFTHQLKGPRFSGVRMTVSWRELSMYHIKTEEPLKKEAT